MKLHKKIIFKSFYHLKFFDALRQLQKNQVIILMYHRFSKATEKAKIPQSIFKNQILFLKSRYNFIRLNSLADFSVEYQRDLPHNSIILTFDDGYRDNYEFAFPILKQFEVPATIFLTTDFINHKKWLWFNKLKYIIKNTKLTKTSMTFDGINNCFFFDSYRNRHKSQIRIFNYCKRISQPKVDSLLETLSAKLKVEVPDISTDDFAPLTWEQIHEMKQNGVEFGSHTRTHRILSRATDAQIRYELIESKADIEKELKQSVKSFCYPVGKMEDIPKISLSIAREAGYTSAVTAIPGRNIIPGANFYSLKRLSIGIDDQAIISKTLTLR